MRDKDPEITPESEPEVRAHTRRERQRLKAELHRFNGPSSTADEIDEPGRAYVPPRHHDRKEPAPPGREKRHWKLPSWKRRTAARHQRALAERQAGQDEAGFDD